MKFLSFAVDGQSRLGMLTDEDRVVDLTLLLRSTPDHGLASIPENVNALIELGDGAVARLRELVAAAGDAARNGPRLDDAGVLPPLRMAKNV